MIVKKEVDNDRFCDCYEPLELRHPVSDTGDICPLPRTEQCRHMNRTFRTSRTTVMQHNRYARVGTVSLVWSHTRHDDVLFYLLYEM